MNLSYFTTRIITFLEGNPNLKLHLPLKSWVVGFSLKKIAGRIPLLFTSKSMGKSLVANGTSRPKDSKSHKNQGFNEVEGLLNG